MKKICLLMCFIVFCFSFGQNVRLSKAFKTNTNNDSNFYKLDKEKLNNSELLGEIEFQMSDKDDFSTYQEILNKAKSIGANAFIMKELPSYDKLYATLELYYTPEKPIEKPTLYIFSTSKKLQNFKVDNLKMNINSKTYHKINLIEGKIYQISVGGMLGAGMKISANSHQPVQYLGISSAGISPNRLGTEGGLNFKTGDINRIDSGFGAFLSAIYMNNQ